MTTETGIESSLEKKIEMGPATIDHTLPGPGGTLIIMQRHGDFDRQTGHLTTEGLANSQERSRVLIDDILSKVPPDERRDLSLLVVASPTIKHEGRRSMETAAAVIESAQSIFDKYGIPAENILTPTPRPSEHIEEPRIFQGDMAFFKFLVDKYGKGTKDFWKAYEKDTHQKEREAMNAEGPVEMSDRFAHFTNVLARYARLFHLNHSDQPARLIIWSVSHYDTLTVYFKNHVARIAQEEYVPVSYDGGLSLLISPRGEATVTIEGTTYSVELTPHGTALARTRDQNI